MSSKVPWLITLVLGVSLIFSALAEIKQVVMSPAAVSEGV
jgi:hypothetical protein